MLRAKRSNTQGANNWKELSEYTGTKSKAAAASPDAAAKRRRRIEVMLNFGGSAVYIVSAAAFIIDYRNTERLSSLMMVFLATLFAFFFITRTTPPQHANDSARDWLVALAGTAAPLLLRPAAELDEVFGIEILQFFGICVSIAGLLTLNNSFGMVAANRGVKTGGIFKYIRHPIYAGYLVALSGFFVQNLTVWNAVVLVCWFFFEMCRMKAEEQILARDPAYAAYMTQTRWRLIPFIF